MKIDKIIFTCSEQFSPFWNLQSRIWKTKLGIEPVCILFGDKSKSQVSEEFGQVIERSFIQGIPDILQITVSKFLHPAIDPEATWIIGDIDMIPLQTKYFKENLEKIPSDDFVYAHLNFGGIAQSRGIDPNVFFEKGGNTTGGFDLPGHYHVAKGKLFRSLYGDINDLEKVVRHLVESRRYGMFDPAVQKYIGLDPTIHGSHWCAEENYTSEILSAKSNDKLISLCGMCYDNRGQRVDRAGWNPKTKTYFCDPNKLMAGGYVDIHCHRPYHEQELAMKSILRMAGMF